MGARWVIMCLLFAVEAAAEEALQRGAFFYAAPTYWKADGEGLALAVASRSSSDLTPAHVMNLNFEWDVGFEVGFGYRIPHDVWSISLGLKHLHTTAERSLHAREGRVLFPIWTLPNSPSFAEQTHGHWRLHLGLLDFLVEKPLQLGKWLSLSPQFGIRTSWIRQKYNLEYNGGAFSTEQAVRMKNKFWGIGPAAGICADYTLAPQWILFGNLLTAINYGQFYLHQDEDQFALDNKVLGLHGMFKQAIWTADLTVGIRWQLTSRETLKRVSVELAWDQIWLAEQNQHLRFMSGGALGLVIANQGSLALKGVHLKARFDF